VVVPYDIWAKSDVDDGQPVDSFEDTMM
jgi:hypothetical protein